MNLQRKCQHIVKMPFPWKKDSKKASVPEEAPILPPIMPPSTSFDEVKAAMDEVVARRASEEAKEGRLAARGVELLGPDAFLFEGRFYREQSKGRWEATEVTPEEIVALRAMKESNSNQPMKELSSEGMVSEQEKKEKGLGKIKTLFSKSSRGSGFGGSREGKMVKGKNIRVLQETAEGLQGGFIEREKAAREAYPLHNPFVNAPSSSITALPPPSTAAAANLTVDRTLVPHFASLRPTRSCVDLIPLSMASAQGGQGGTRGLSDASVARREVFPPQNLCRMRLGRRPGMFTLTARTDTAPELLEVYFPEGSTMEISSDVAMTLYRDLYDQIRGLESESLGLRSTSKSSQGYSTSRGETVSKGGSSITDEAVISAIDKGRETKLTKEAESPKKPSGSFTKRTATRSRSFLDTVLMGASSAMNLKKESSNLSRKAGGGGGGFLNVPRDDDEMFISDDDDTPQMYRDVQTRLTTLQARPSSIKLSSVKTSQPITTTTSPTSIMAGKHHPSQAIPGTSSESTHQPSPMREPEAQETPQTVFELEAIPAGSSAAVRGPAVMEGNRGRLDNRENLPNISLAPAQPEAVVRDVAAIHSMEGGSIKDHGPLNGAPGHRAHVRAMVAQPPKQQLHDHNHDESGNLVRKRPSWSIPQVPQLTSRFDDEGILIENPLRDSGDGRYPGAGTCITKALNRHIGSGKADQGTKPCVERPFGEPRSGPLGGKVDKREFDELFPKLTKLALGNQHQSAPVHAIAEEPTTYRLAESITSHENFPPPANRKAPEDPRRAAVVSVLSHPVTRMREPDSDFHRLKARRHSIHEAACQPPKSEQSDNELSGCGVPALSEQRLPEMAPAA
ncbi:hypothetical protein TWF718_003489 [Orbilia javanica]|uniref:Uncharacterized protein n=1 Tax=Orbilia javanica TaxID=47235 RepID=A0AAN8MNQ4_9PEZI